jgi:hypothetical protein
MRNELYLRLNSFLSTCTKDQLIGAMSEEWLNTILPGICDCVGCDQGSDKHFEGDVSVHTALAFVNLLDVSRKQLKREADFVERLAALMHDWKKPAVKAAHGDGSVSFPHHEALAAAAVPEVARRLELSDEESAKLLFLVAEHGTFHDFPSLSREKQKELHSSPYCASACALQMADALSCLLKNGECLPVHWNLILRLTNF